MIHASVKIIYSHSIEILEEKINTFFGEVSEECELIEIKYIPENENNYPSAMIIYKIKE